MGSEFPRLNSPKSTLWLAVAALVAMLLFKKKFLQAIRAGEKTQTIRLWPWRRMRTGQRSYIPGVGYIRVDAVEQVCLEELTDEDATPDGFSTAEELRAEIESIYGDKMAAGYLTFRVVFHVLGEDELMIGEA